ncbi:MAG TPA: cytochrome c biogenesis protein ResB, partial [Bacteroidales bacterium]|nr:cytochrome c biogenesis protein ResB [Bacteroidales bacterium]
MKYFRFLFSPVFMGSLFIIFAFAMAAATFIENDYGSAAAYGMVYDTRWFELILLLLTVNLIGQLVIHRLFRKEKLPVALFHLAFVLILAGAGITRYFGQEGQIHIREGERNNTCTTNERYLTYAVTDSSGVKLLENTTEHKPSKLSSRGLREKIHVRNKEYELVFAGMMSDRYVFHLFGGGKPSMVMLAAGPEGSQAAGSAEADGLHFEISYGPGTMKLPFSILLNEFVLERYPGSDSPSGYRSDVTVIDENENVEMPFMIFMNNVLKYKGYRFYQSSYDPDEMGTILSVNHDRAGMIVTYTGYSFLFFFILLSLLIRKSLFRTVRATMWTSALRKSLILLLFFTVLSGLGSISAQQFVPGKKASDELGKILIQDQKGRTKPLYTMSNDIVRKVTGGNKFGNYSSMQFFLGFLLDFDHWKEMPVIKVNNEGVRKKAGISGRYASFSDLVDFSGEGHYKLSEDVRAAYSKSPGSRNKTDKEVMKVDERVNIIFMISRGDFLRIFPLNDTTHNWGPPHEALVNAPDHADSLYLQNIIPALVNSVQENNKMKAAQVVSSVRIYQERFAEYKLPSVRRVVSEVLYYRLVVFERLFPLYLFAGLAMIVILIITVITNRPLNSPVLRILGWLLVAGFTLHTSGLALRWYISGHVPLSNGYESMIFISWITLLAGLIFRRRSEFALSSTAVLAGLTLLVAHMSFMDPEITNLVPVLKSYWLTLHVSVITGS